MKEFIKVCPGNCYSTSSFMVPACSIECTSGALNNGTPDEQDVGNMTGWFPEKKFQAALILTGQADTPLNELVPEHRFGPEPLKNKDNGPVNTSKWSLVTFSFLTTISVAKIISTLIDGIYPEKYMFLSLVFVAGFSSLFHLGKINTAWRIMVNLKSSPFSLQIVLFILYAFSSGLSVVYQIPVLFIASSVFGLVLLASVDRVYIFADKRRSVFLYSGQCFISALLIVSFLTGKILPFIFIASVRLTASVFSFSLNKSWNLHFSVRFIRLALLILTGTSMISGISYPGNAIVILFLSGELLDRILFYIDFKPLNIKY
jgi:DMSO reductase anchor subunit